MLSINTNISALHAKSALDTATEAINTSIQRLSTGKRVNSAADDPGMTGYISRMKSQVNGLDQAYTNIETGNDLIQTASDALSGLDSMDTLLQQMRSLAVEAANVGTLTSSDLQDIQDEMESLVSDIDRISQQTEFNTKRLLNGDSVATINVSSPDVVAYATGEVNDTSLLLTSITPATKWKVQASATTSNKMPTALTSSDDATATKGAATFSVATTAATFNADYDIIFTPDNSSYDFVVYYASSGATVGTGSFSASFSDPNNSGATITINSGSSTIESGYKGIWHADTNPSNNKAQEGNRAASATITLDDLSDTAALQETFTVEFDWVNNQLSYRVLDSNGEAQGPWVANGEEFTSYTSSDLGGSKFTLSSNVTQSGFSGSPGKGDEWTFTFKEYSGLTSQGTIAIDVGTSSYTVTWNQTDTIEEIKNRINSAAGSDLTAYFSGSSSLLTLQSEETGSDHAISVRDVSGNLAITMGFQHVSGTGSDASFYANGEKYGPQSSNIFNGVSTNLVIGLKEDISDTNASISVRDSSQTLHVGANANQTFSYYILRTDSLTLGLKDLEGNYNFDVTESGGAEKAISTIDEAIQKVSDEASRLGAYQNRLTYAAGYTSNAELTATEALGTVENADYPEELINLTLNQIKQESSATMLAQSNLQAQRVFELLFGGGTLVSG